MSLFTALQRRAEGRWTSNPFVRAYACWMAREAVGDPRDAYARYAGAPKAFPHSLGHNQTLARPAKSAWNQTFAAHLRQEEPGKCGVNFYAAFSGMPSTPNFTPRSSSFARAAWCTTPRLRVSDSNSLRSVA